MPLRLKRAHDEKRQVADALKQTANYAQQLEAQLAYEPQQSQEPQELQECQEHVRVELETHKRVLNALTSQYNQLEAKYTQVLLQLKRTQLANEGGG